MPPDEESIVVPASALISHKNSNKNPIGQKETATDFTAEFQVRCCNNFYYIENEIKTNQYDYCKALNLHLDNAVENTGGRMPNQFLNSEIQFYNPCGLLKIQNMISIGSQFQSSSLSDSDSSSAFLSHSTNFFICSRKMLLPFAILGSLYHFKIASSLRTSTL